MLILFDLGNSRVKWGCWEEGKVSLLGAQSYAEPLQPRLAEIGGQVPTNITRVAGVSVADSARERYVEDVVHELFDLNVEWLTASEQSCGVSNGYKNPSQLGADRWAALIAARGIAPEGACVIDVGTAITIDGLDNKGRHLGGAIFPGERALALAMSGAAAGIDVRHRQVQPTLPALCTEDALLAGISCGVKDAVRGLSQRIAAECPRDFRGLVTGGGGKKLINNLPSGYRWEYRESLVLEGVGRMMESHSRSG
ncbi:pantothenate kinase type III [Halorhodospira halochloris]|uniref:Type III pantothenate kinase n=1 Tax=Halorhodospira halochloris TaxID=1052 RepID=A0A0X8XBJ6_HALHR|nr:type III pantothenate kinase [Halorhodospira halochloris]MCG5549593.1 type III pantothenate kinase [Halorhodospira halochloris]BAU58949.1 pantothenate kinase type III [Halorhodospira halochloris]